MTTQSFIHSNAFNFMSFVQGGVDERTGQYTLSIELPELPSNALVGPSLPLRLSFSPLNNVNSGFGKGWTLQLSQYNLNDNKLDLHTGQSFKISDNGPGEPAPVPERKLELFHFENRSEGNTHRYRIAHKSGIVEWLQPQPSDLRLALPVRVEAPSGHGITLAYHPTKKGCLQSIVDDAGRTLLKIEYVGDSKVELTLLPNSAASSLYSLLISGDRLTGVTLPTSNGAGWTIDYAQKGESLCITQLDTPLGATELIEYQERGHLFPGSTEEKGRALSYVNRHVIKPGAGQADMETTYTYTASNFLGYGSLTSWVDNGEDNLYRVADRAFKYGATATSRRDGEPVRTVEKIYNRFHLMIEEITVEQACTRRINTKYHERNVDFVDQPKYFQMPETVTTSWEFDCPEAPVHPRSETVTTEYDDFANQTLEVQPSGLRIERTFYPQDDDPEKFVRHLEQEIVRPAEGYEAGAQTLRTHYRYALHPSVMVDGPGWLVNRHEDKYQLHGDGSQTVLQEIERTYVNDEPIDPLTHGRLEQEITTRNGRQTTIDYSYSDTPEKPTTHPVLVTQQVITAFDHGPKHHARKEITLQHSLLIGEPLLNRDDNDVEIEYEYDLLRRVIRETVAPGTAYTASRHYHYALVSSSGGKATQEQIDVKGVSTLSTVDGLNRVVEAKRIDRDFVQKGQEPNYRPTYKAMYDGLGDLIEEVEFDWHRDEDVPLKTTFSYDNWGQRCKTVGPDKVVHHDQVDPIGTPERLGPVRRTWSESEDAVLGSGQTITFMNLFEKPVRVERLTASRKPYSVHQYFYDGLGRSVREKDAEQNETWFSYDAFNRLVDHTLADRALVHRDYALHSTGDLPELIQVTRRGGSEPSVLGLQRFDGLDRLVESTTGGRLRSLEYEPGQRKPKAVITPKKKRIEYKYVPQLGEEAVERKQVDAGITGHFDYDPQNARLLSCSEHGVAMTRDYFSTGELKSETCSFDGGKPYEMKYVHSLQGKMLSYIDVLGAEQSYSYDGAARLKSTRLGTLHSNFEYDDLGRNDFFETIDNTPGEPARRLGTQLKFDDFDREISRTFDFGDAKQTLSQRYDKADRIIGKVLRQGKELLRREVFDYDERGRLVEYTCSGIDEYLPVDPYGNRIRRQTFRFDAVDNITRVLTAHAQGEVDVVYHFANLADPAQLTGFTVRGMSEQPIEVRLEYDDDGNMVVDEQGRQLAYDALGRLESVNGFAYGYDPLDRLVSQEQP